jgi:glycosyltransferase involved in cell wall biosynthesis
MNRDDTFDIVIGIPSYNEADSISHVVEIVGQGLETYYPDKKRVIVNVDNCSPDNTREAFLGAATRIEKKYISTENNVRGKGNNFFNLFQFSRQVHAQAVAVVDADLKSITKEWVDYLLKPVYEGYDFVTPQYSRHQFDGSLTNHICYPVTFGMLARDIRQPIGGDFAFSPRLMNFWLDQPWTESVKQYGIDIFMTLHALFGGFNICQTGLGTKEHKSSGPKLGLMFDQVAETLFNVLLQNKDKWMDLGVNDLKTTTVFGMNIVKQPQEFEFNMREIKDKCLNAYRENMWTIKEILDSYAFSRIKEMSAMDYYNMESLLWTQVFYTLIHKYDRTLNDEGKKRIINAMKPLFLARSISFNYETWKYNIKYVEQEIRNQALVFTSQKNYLWGLYNRTETKE